jgi:hypothetical protein
MRTFSDNLLWRSLKDFSKSLFRDLANQLVILYQLVWRYDTGTSNLMKDVNGFWPHCTRLRALVFSH